jgi:hypothetical protein
MSITNFICTRTAEQTFRETLSAMGEYALLQQALAIRPSFLCRGMAGELIMLFKDCDRCNKVKIELCEVDMYTMTFYSFSFGSENRGCQVVEILRDIGREQLQHSFEEFTELSLTLKLGEKNSYNRTNVSDKEKN